MNLDFPSPQKMMLHIRRNLLRTFVLLLTQIVMNRAIQTLNETQKITPMNSGVQDFGSDLSVSGQNLVVAGPKYDGNKGAIYTFNYNGSEWGNEILYEPKNAPSRVLFGTSVSIKNDRFIVGHEKDGTNGANSGAAYIYNLTSSGLWELEQKITASDGVATDAFGRAVAINDDFAVVSARLDDDSNGNSGSVYPFNYSSSSWNELTKITAEAESNADAYFGRALSMNDDYMIVAANGHNNLKGAIFLFKKTGSSFLREEYISVETDQHQPEKCGQAVAIYGNRFAFSCSKTISNGSPSDHWIVFVYAKNATGSWVQETTLMSPSKSGTEEFGSSIAMWKESIVIGAAGEEMAYVYELSNGAWNLTMILEASDGQSGTKFGSSLTFEEGKILVGSPSNDAVYFYDVSTTETVEQNTNSTNMTQNDQFSFECSNTGVTGYWPKSIFTGIIEEIAFTNASCNNFTSNNTHVWISASFDTCGSFIEQHEDFIFQGNSANVKVKYADNIIYRIENHLYNMKCMFSRTQNISLGDGYEVTNSTAATMSINSTVIAKYDIQMDIYTSTDFLTKESAPLKVAMNEPIHIGIKKAGTASNIKIIVEKCFATPTASLEGDSYIFFHKKCPLDSSFEILENTPNDFSFVFKTFTFIKLSRAVYIHCRVRICEADDNSEACSQICSSRKRRSPLTSQNEVEIAFVSSPRIEFVKKETCSDLNCPEHAQCVQSYPAMCRCNTGYVFSFIERICKNERILKLDQLHLDLEWKDIYADANSLEFIKLANKTETNLMNTFTALELSEIEGVRVFNPRRGSVIFDVHVIYAQSSTDIKTFNKIKNILQSNDERIKEALTASRILTDKVITMEEKPVQELETYALVLIVALGLTLSIFIIVVSVYILVRRKRMTKTNETEGCDNKGIEIIEQNVP